MPPHTSRIIQLQLNHLVGDYYMLFLSNYAMYYVMYTTYLIVGEHVTRYYINLLLY